MIAMVILLAIAVNKPYRSTSFFVEGDVFSAAVENGSTLLLNLHNDKKSIEWSIIQTPECYACDYSVVAENVTEFHIIVLNHGEGVMQFQCLLADGTVEKYALTLSISRHQKTHAQIDSVSFMRVSE